SFLAILTGDGTLLQELATALQNPAWPLFLGRKRCVPGTPVFAGFEPSQRLETALRRDGLEGHDHSLVPPDETPTVRVQTELLDTHAFERLAEVDVGDDLAASYEQARSYVTDRPVHLDPPVHAGRIVLDFHMQRPTPTLLRPCLHDELFGEPGPQNQLQRGSDPDAKKRARVKSAGRCIFCRCQPADPTKLHAHHLTYVRRGREFVSEDHMNTTEDDFVMLCEECHDAVSMMEYQAGFGVNRIDPRKPEWRSRILQAREDRRQQRALAIPQQSPVPDWIAIPRSEATVLFESVIPLRAGRAFAEDAPGNRWLANRHHVHQRLSMAFPAVGGPSAATGYGVRRDEGGFLFRIEDDEAIARLVVRSRLLPDWGRAFLDAGWLFDATIPSPWTLEVSNITVGSQWRFRLEANPTVKRKVQGRKNGRREAYATPEEQIAWFHRKAINGGFTVATQQDSEGEAVPDIRITAAELQRARRRKDQRTLSHHGVRFDGILHVTDEEKFAETLAAGIGSAKAFGFGLLSIARA
ncbi:MAG: type I-E CRISPR-associated protein Cas6/Cse3/CasE, partial [Planctomycetaceae bacterium]